MGFPEAETRAALSAAMGNPDLAYEFLLTGIPEQALAASHAHHGVGAMPAALSTPRSAVGGPANIQNLRQHPQFNTLKQLIQQNPAALPQVLNLIGQQSPELLEAIHQNEAAFIAMMNEPITDAPPPTGAALGSGPAGTGAGNPAAMVEMLNSMPPQQRAAFAQSLGMSPDQLAGFTQMMASMPPEQLNQMMGSMRGMGGAGGEQGGIHGGNVIRLTDDEMAAVNRLVELGFDQQQAAQAYLACDKNEALAANMLLEGGFMDDDEGGAHGDHEDDMYH